MSESDGDGVPGRDDLRESAEAAGLRYVNDSEPGITRRRCGQGWSYRDPDGETIRDDEVRERIESLAVPPAWDEVWICPDPDGHLQATGRDDEGRKQYRYHPRWEDVRSATKFDRMLAFGRALREIRSRVRRGLELDGLPREKALAAVVHLLESTCLRVGNEEYERENGTYGLTTVHDRHVQLRAAEIRFRFPGKGGEEVTASVTDDRVAEVVRDCQELPGQELFTYRDGDGEPRDVTSGDVNDYLEEISERTFTAKDFRTWMGTLHAFAYLVRLDSEEREEDREGHCREAVDRAADCLGNSRSVCREFYVHPGVLEAYREGDLPPDLADGRGGSDPLSPVESALLEVLESITVG